MDSRPMIMLSGAQSESSEESILKFKQLSEYGAVRGWDGGIVVKFGNINANVDH